MRIKNKYYHALWVDKNNDVKIINQLLLPFMFEIKTLKTVEDTFSAIKNMEVRGAPLIGSTGAFGVYLAALSAQKTKNPYLYINEKAKYLKTSRPTAVNLFYAIDAVINELDTNDTTEQLIQKSFNKATLINNLEIESCKLIGEYGLPLIEEISKKKNGETVNILTHCNAGWIACGDYGTATAPIYFAHDKGIKVHVWVDETRPRNQGARLTAWELGEHGVPHTVITDNAGGHLMQHGLVDIIIVGSDRTTINGDVANKIGTYLKALAAFDNNIPFYAAMPSSTIDWEMEDGIKNIPIEERNPEEVTHIEGFANNKIQKIQLTPHNSTAKNYGFDVTPARLVTGIITEKGICSASKKGILTLFSEK